MTDLAIPPLPPEAQPPQRSPEGICATRATHHAQLDGIPFLPEPFRRLAQHQLRDPRASSDHLLLMADGLIEAAEAAAMEGMLALGASLRILAAELRALAPLYGPGEARRVRA